MKNVINEVDSFDYNSIPLGYYDNIANKKKGIRSFWHYLKFKRVIDSIEKNTNSILDIGCFAGTFLGMIPKSQIAEQVGIDIVDSQIFYAREKYGTDFRNFYTVSGFEEHEFLPDNHFEYISCIEVLEHLTFMQINKLFLFAYKKLKSGGKFIITTPNYLSVWPLLEFMLNYYSKVNYEEQHISRFNYFNILKEFRKGIKDFDRKFKLDFNTTTHLFTPYLASLSFTSAEKISRFISPSNWKMPFGALILIQIEKI